MAAGRGLNFQPFYSHYVLLLTWVLALVGWLIAFFAMCVGEARKNASVSGPLFNTAWFGIFLQLAVMFGFGWGIATDTLPLYQLQLSTFGAVALVFAVSSTNNIFGNGSQQAAGAGWLLLSIADIIWLLFLTSEKPTFLWHSLNSFSHVQITHPSGTRSFPASSGSMRVGGGGNRSSSIQEIHPSSSRSGLGSGGVYYPPHSSSQVKLNGGADQDGGHVASPIGSRRDLESGSVGNGAIGGREVAAGSSVGAAGAGAGEGGFLLKAKALYSYQASPDDPQEMSFTKGEILDIADNSGKWWSARKADGTVGICPSNYLQLIQ